MEFIFILVGIIVGSIIAWLALGKKSAKLEERNRLTEEQNKENESMLTEEREKVLQLNSQLSSLQSDYSNLQTNISELKKNEQQLLEKFENIANKIFEEKTTKFSEQSKTNLQEILNPLKERITEFQTKVEETNKDSISRNAALREQLKSLKDMNQQMSTDAQNLVKALKGDSKAQGDWGEIQLERILERSGLIKGQEYTIQPSFTTEEGSRRRPDVIVNLPEEKKIIIDSKVSLVDYEKLVSAETDDEKNIHLKSFIDSLKRHIKGLSEKRYQDLYDLGSLDFVLMFIPIEPAFTIAIQFGDELYSQAWDKRIMMVSPLNLFVALKTIANIWKQEYQNQNVIEIAKQSGALYDKFVGFVEDLVNVGNRIDQAKSGYVDAMKKLSEGRDNLVSKTERIRKLGAKTSKSLPQSILDRAVEDSEE